MSTFNRVVGLHGGEAERDAIRRAEAADAAAKDKVLMEREQKRRSDLGVEWEKQFKRYVIPAFRTFAQDARKLGYWASASSGGEQSAQLYFSPVLGSLDALRLSGYEKKLTRSLVVIRTGSSGFFGFEKDEPLVMDVGISTHGLYLLSLKPNSPEVDRLISDLGTRNRADLSQMERVFLGWHRAQLPELVEDYHGSADDICEAFREYGKSKCIGNVAPKKLEDGFNSSPGYDAESMLVERTGGAELLQQGQIDDILAEYLQIALNLAKAKGWTMDNLICDDREYRDAIEWRQYNRQRDYREIVDDQSRRKLAQEGEAIPDLFKGFFAKAKEVFNRL